MRTPESVRAEAAEQFAACVDLDQRLGRSTEKALRDQELGMRFVDAALSMAEGSIFNVSEHFPADETAQEVGRDIMGESFRVMPYLCGSLRLFRMEFAHATEGVVPHTVARALMEGAAAVTHNGVSMTGNDVYLQFRRRPLNQPRYED